MQPESVWKWLDAVDQEHLDPLDQWCAPTLQVPTQKAALKPDNVFRGGGDDALHHADAASPSKPTPPSGLLLRTGNIRMIGSMSSSDVGNKEHPVSLVPNSPATVTVEVKRKPSFQPVAPSTIITPKAIGQRTHHAPTHQVQFSADTKNIPIRRKRVPTYFGRAQTEALQSIPTIQVEVADPVAVECQGARVAGGSASPRSNSRRHTTATGEGALHRSNAVKRPSNVRPGSRSSRIS